MPRKNHAVTLFRTDERDSSQVAASLSKRSTAEKSGQVETNMKRRFAVSNSAGYSKNRNDRINQAVESPKRRVNRKRFPMVIKDSKYPNYKIRAKDPSSVGMDNVKQVSGYIDVRDEDKHFFFWLFESRNDPKNDPLILWLNGGPGCSSATGMLFEIGPSMLQPNGSLVPNMYSWNNNATVIFLDQPVNVGYSYSGANDTSVNTSFLAGEDIYSFLSLFFRGFPAYQGLDFHIAGESYAGHYIPEIAHAILSHDDREFDVSSLIIGNGIIDPLNQNRANVAMACGEGDYDSVLDEDTCNRLYGMLPQCNALTQSCYSTNDTLMCMGANAFCDVLTKPYYNAGGYAYDIRINATANPSPYPAMDAIDAFLKQTSIKEAVGAEIDIDYQSCNDAVDEAFANSGDGDRNVAPAIRIALEQNISVLIFAGDKDYICNWIGNKQWTDRLQWYGKAGYARESIKVWTDSNNTYGEGKSYGPLTYLRVYDAGHMVGHDQPEAALALINQWTQTGQLDFNHSLPIRSPITAASPHASPGLHSHMEHSFYTHSHQHHETRTQSHSEHSHHNHHDRTTSIATPTARKGRRDVVSATTISIASQQRKEYNHNRGHQRHDHNDRLYL